MRLPIKPYTTIPSYTCPIIDRIIFSLENEDLTNESIIKDIILDFELLKDANRDLRRSTEDYSDYSDKLQDYIEELQNKYDKIETENQQLKDELNK